MDLFSTENIYQTSLEFEHLHSSLLTLVFKGQAKLPWKKKTNNKNQTTLIFHFELKIRVNRRKVSCSIFLWLKISLFACCFYEDRFISGNYALVLGRRFLDFSNSQHIPWTMSIIYFSTSWWAAQN